jgi:hypothetical protein
MQYFTDSEKLPANSECSTVGKFLPGIGKRQGEIVPDFHAGTAQTKNRASWSEGDQKARGIFEFSTPVGLAGYPAAAVQH